MKAIEIRVRKLAGLGEDVIGVDLMNKVFALTGSLTDTSAVKGEQDGARMLFAGAYAVLRNPAGQRLVDYADLSEAAEAVQTASPLMRILDRVEDRLLVRLLKMRSTSSLAGRRLLTMGQASSSKPKPTSSPSCSTNTDTANWPHRWSCGITELTAAHVSGVSRWLNNLQASGSGKRGERPGRGEYRPHR